MSWKSMISEHMKEFGESFDDLVECTIDDEELSREFYDGYGGEEGSPFTLWTNNRVYFPVCYDGAEWVGSAPRNPCNESCRHFGGG